VKLKTQSAGSSEKDLLFPDGILREYPQNDGGGRMTKRGYGRVTGGYGRIRESCGRDDGRIC
jgi:hypothetical protein